MLRVGEVLVTVYKKGFDSGGGSGVSPSREGCIRVGRVRDSTMCVQ